jgi:hypothetical protein
MGPSSAGANNSKTNEPAQSPTASPHSSSSGAPSAPPPAGPVLHVARITDIKQGAEANGVIPVTVAYLRGCGETFEGIAQGKVSPSSLSHATVGVAVVMNAGPACLADDVPETASFSLPKFAGVYEFEPVTDYRGQQVTSRLAVPALILSTLPRSPADGAITVDVNVNEPCGSTFFGLLTSPLSGHSSSHPRVGVVAVASVDSPPSSICFDNIESVFSVPAIAGKYSFFPVTPR